MKNLIASLTLEEKAALLTGAASMATAEISRLGIKGKNLADGPHGVRSKREDNCTHFPNLCCLGTILHTNGRDYTIRRVGVDMIG